jgi:hypothetical protein
MHVLYAISDMLSVLTFPNELRQENDSETKKYSYQAAQKKGRENKMRDGGDAQWARIIRPCKSIRKAPLSKRS